MRRWWRPTLALAVVGLAVYAGWSARNLYYNGYFTYSSHTNFTLLFYRALSAEHLATGRPTTDIQSEYVRLVYEEAGDPRAQERIEPDDMWDFQRAENAALHSALQIVALDRLRRFWPYALLGTGVGLWRMYMVTLAYPTWFWPVEILYRLILYGLAAWGGWQAFRRRDLTVLLVCAVPVLYVTAITLGSQVSGMDTRMSSPIMPPLVVLALYGGARAFDTVQAAWQHRVRQSAPVPQD